MELAKVQGLGDAAAIVLESWCEGLRPDPQLTVSEWADGNRVLSRVSSKEAGRWRTARTPYLREPMDCLSAHSPVRKVVLMAGAQVGKTEVLLNFTGYTMDAAPGPLLFVQPGLDLAQRFVRQRIDPMLSDTPSLQGICGNGKGKSGSDSMMLKTFAGGVLVMVGANSGAGLRSMPAAKLALDEVDAYPEDVDGEGDPVQLAERALRTYGTMAKECMVSTPTIEGRSRIKREYLLGDCRRYHVPCPFCDHLQLVEWRRIEWSKDDPSSVWLNCEQCEERIPESYKTQMLAAGVWVPEFPERSESVRSYHLPALLAPLGMRSWADIVETFEKGKKDVRVRRVWVNHDLAETWTEKGEVPEWEALYRRRENYPQGHVPSGALVLTCGVDVQANRLELEVVGWGPNLESWSIDYMVLVGDPAKREVWDDLARVLNHPWPSTLGVPLRISKMAVDSGYQTQNVYAWVRSQSIRLVMAIKGNDRYGVLLTPPKMVEVTGGGKRSKGGLGLWNVGTSHAKEELYGWLRQSPPLELEGGRYPAGWAHFPQYGQEYFKQLCAEQLVTRVVRGTRKYVWEPVQERNEALDCRVYARAAAQALTIDRWGPQDWKTWEQQIRSTVEPRAAKPRSEKQDEGDYLNRWE